MTKAIIFFIIGNVLAWFQFNSQFVWDAFKDRPILTCAIFSFPMSLSFWYAINFVMSETEYLWTSKLVGFGVSNIVFAILTWIFMNQGIFNAKTMVTLLLATIIIALQIFWK